jgi:hypothetical protein
MMTMKEVCEYVKTTRIAEAKKHRKEITQGDLCSGLTDREYNKVRTKVKGAGSRGRKHSHTKLWSHYAIPTKQFTN